MRYYILATAMVFIGGLCPAGLVTASDDLQAERITQTAREQQVAVQEMSRDQIREMQRALNDKGFAAGTEDGIVGAQTQSAIRNFQNQQGLSSTGKPDHETLRALGFKAGEDEFTGVSPEFDDTQLQNEYREEMIHQMEDMDMMHEREQMQPMEQLQHGSGPMKQK